MRFVQIFRKGAVFFFYIILAGLFLKGEVFRVYAGGINLSFTSVKNPVLIFIVWQFITNFGKKKRLSLPSAAAVGAVLITVLFSVSPLLSLKAYGVFLIYLFWFYAAGSVMQDKRVRINACKILVVCACFVNMADLLFHYSTGWGTILERYPFWKGKNALGLFLVTGMCISGTAAARPAFLYVLNISLLVIGILFSYSRSAWLAALCVFMLFVCRRGKRFLGITAGLAAVLVVLFSSSLRERAGAFASGRDANVNQRLLLWENTLRMSAERPVTGTGIGTFTYAYRKVYPDAVPLSGPESRVIRHAHNLYLQILEEGGLPSLVVFFWLVVSGFVLGIRNLSKETDPQMKSIRYGSLLGISAFLVYSVTDCTVTWEFIGDSFSHINLIWLFLWAVVLN